MVKAIEVVLSDGRKVTVHEPKTKDMGTFLNAIPALTSLYGIMGGLFPDMTEGEKPKEEIAITQIPKIPEGLIEGIFPLLSSTADMTVEEYQELSMWDGLAILMAMTGLIPKDFLQAQQALQTLTSTDGD